MATYNIPKTRKGWTITKDGELLAGRYQSEQAALMSLAFGLWRNITDDEPITDDIVAEAIAKIALNV